jgi:hypothetical protein
MQEEITAELSMEELTTFIVSEAACTLSTAVFSLGLALFTLTTLFQGIQNIPLHSIRQSALKNQVFLCIITPIVIVYFAKLTWIDFIQATKKRINW